MHVWEQRAKKKAFVLFFFRPVIIIPFGVHSHTHAFFFFSFFASHPGRMCNQKRGAVCVRLSRRTNRVRQRGKEEEGEAEEEEERLKPTTKCSLTVPFVSRASERGANFLLLTRRRRCITSYSVTRLSYLLNVTI